MRFRKTASGVLATAACVLAITACGRPGAPGAAAGPVASRATATAGRTAGAASSGPSTAAGRAKGGVTACAASQLRIVLTYTGAVAGQAGGYLRFTNDSRATCSLTGWPVVAGVTAGGKVTTFRHARSTMFGAWQYSAPLPVVTLRPGNSAYTVVAADDQPAGSQTGCPAPDVRLRVAAPGDGSATLISAWLPGARTYLPACTSVNGSPTGETSAITTLSRLAH
jgi:hypothetical protein